MSGLQVSFVCIPSFESLRTICAHEWSFSCVSSQVFLEMTWMSELSTTVFACKSALVVVNEHMVVQAVLPCKCSIADKAHKWFYSCMASVVVHEGSTCCKGFVFAYSAIKWLLVFLLFTFQFTDTFQGCLPFPFCRTFFIHFSSFPQHAEVFIIIEEFIICYPPFPSHRKPWHWGIRSFP